MYIAYAFKKHDFENKTYIEPKYKFDIARLGIRKFKFIVPRASLSKNDKILKYLFLTHGTSYIVPTSCM